MKKYLLIVMAAMMAVACSKGDDGLPVVVDCPEGMGIVSLSVNTMPTIDGTRAGEVLSGRVELADLGVTIPAGENFKLQISNPTIDYSREWLSIKSYNQDYKKTYLKADDNYTFAVWFGNENEGVNEPYFYGEVSQNVNARQLNEVEINAKLANSIVKVAFTDRFKAYFENGAAIKITSDKLDAEGGVVGESNSWDVNYSESPYIFVKSGNRVTISGSAIKQKPSATVDAPTVTFDNVVKTMEPCKLYTYVFDVATAGNVSVTVTITNEPAETIEVSDGEEMNDDAIYEQPESDDESGDDSGDE